MRRWGRLDSAGADVFGVGTLLIGCGGQCRASPCRCRTYLADPGGDEANARMREKQLGAHRVASTVVCCRLLESAWKLEVEAIAAA